MRFEADSYEPARGIIYMAIRRLLLTLLAVAAVAAAQAPAPPLQLAREEFDAGRFAKASELYRSMIASDANNANALAGLVDSMEAVGDWRGAMQPLARLVALQPGNTARLAQLGRWESWQPGLRDRALQDLHSACQLDSSNPSYCTDYADVLAWRAESVPQAVAELRTVIARSPSYVPATARLAEILSWNKNTYEESIKLFEIARRLDPSNVVLMTTYAEVLSYNPSSRGSALVLYNAALSLEPHNARAEVGKAQLLAWSGRSNEAIAIYDSVLGVDPNNAGALRGKAEILNWRGEYVLAADLLGRARASAVDDLRVAAELARTQLGLLHYRDAQETVATLPVDPQYRDIREGVSRALGTWMQVGLAVRRNRQHLDYDRLLISVSTPIGFSNRLTFHYAPTLYSSPERDFNSNSYGVDLDTTLSDHLTLQSSANTESYPGLTPQVGGALQLHYRIRPSTQIQAGFQRSAIEESLVSLRGSEVGGVFAGQVASNLGTVGLSYSNSARRYDVSLAYTDGVYTGRNLEPNRQRSVESNIGKSVAGKPYIRVAYGFTYSTFDYDADTETAGLRRAGGYFSPSRFLLNYGGLTVSHKFGDRLQLEATATAGAQNVETSTASFGNAQFASSFTSRVLWRVSGGDEIRLQYDFLNVYNAFHRHLPAVSWRHYF
jgi:tetratricopeptide (TPR) repeat protein